MRHRMFLFSLAAILLIVLFGCSERQGAHSESVSDPDVTEVQLFEKGKGLRVPDEMQRTLGVETVEVTEKRLANYIERPAQVYRTASGSEPGMAIAWLSQADAVSLNVGQSINLTTSQSIVFTGSLARLEQRLTNLLGQSEAIIEFSDPERRVSIGTLLTASFADARINAVTAVPASAVVRGVESPFVYTVSGAHYVRTPVKTGVEQEGWVEVVDGLYAGDAVVARAVEALWNIELCALKGGSPCCPVGKRPVRHED